MVVVCRGGAVSWRRSARAGRAALAGGVARSVGDRSQVAPSLHHGLGQTVRTVGRSALVPAHAAGQLWPRSRRWRHDHRHQVRVDVGRELPLATILGFLLSIFDGVEETPKQVQHAILLAAARPPDPSPLVMGEGPAQRRSDCRDRYSLTTAMTRRTEARAESGRPWRATGAAGTNSTATASDAGATQQLGTGSAATMVGAPPTANAVSRAKTKRRARRNHIRHRLSISSAPVKGPPPRPRRGIQHHGSSPLVGEPAKHF